MNRRSIIKVLVSVITILLVIFSLAGANETVTIDLSASNNKGEMRYRASGFLGGVYMDLDNNEEIPLPRWLNPVKPKLLRQGSYGNYWGSPATVVGIHDRASRIGAKTQALLCGDWGYDRPGVGWPYERENMSLWRDVVSAQVYNAWVHGWNDIEWEVWNEPNWSEFWPGTFDQFCDTWKTAYQAIKDVDSNATIVGPTTYFYDANWIKNFLTYCKNNNCLPTVLSWHECAWPKDGSDVTIIKRHVDDIVSWMALNGIPINRISINEWGHYSEVIRPGPVIHNMVCVEEAPSIVESAAHTMWLSSTLGETCNPDPGMAGRLGGELSCNFLPRAGWWAIKGYAEIAGNRYGVRHSSTVFGIAGMHSTRAEARVILGRNTTGSDIDVNVSFTNVPYHFLHIPNNKVRCVAHRIDDAGLAEIGEPLLSVNGLYTIYNGVLTATLPLFGPKDAYTVRIFKKAAKCDYDGDGVSDLAQSSAGVKEWSILLSSSMFEALKDPFNWGLPTDVTLCGDYDGDGRSDYAVYRPGYPSEWYIIRSGYGNLVTNIHSNKPNKIPQWGSNIHNDIPICGDYDGDGRTDIVVYRPGPGGSSGWYILKSSDDFNVNLPVYLWGSTDVDMGGGYYVDDFPISGDFDGDGRTDFAVYRPNRPKQEGGFYDSEWWIVKSSDGYPLGVGNSVPKLGESYWSGGELQGDVPICADFDGDGKTDIATFRSDAVCVWKILWSSTGFTTQNTYYFGQSGYADIPVTGDFDGDGKSDITVFRPGGVASWYILKSSTGFSSYSGYSNGIYSDRPIGRPSQD